MPKHRYDNWHPNYADAALSYHQIYNFDACIQLILFFFSYHVVFFIAMVVDCIIMKFLDFRQVLHGSAGAMSPQVQARSQQLPGSTPV
jgi:hypothetical protein